MAYCEPQLRWADILDHEVLPPEFAIWLVEQVAEAFDQPVPELRWFDVPGEFAQGVTHWDAGFLAVAAPPDDVELALEILLHECTHLAGIADHTAEFWGLMEQIADALADGIELQAA